MKIGFSLPEDSKESGGILGWKSPGFVVPVLQSFFSPAQAATLTRDESGMPGPESFGVQSGGSLGLWEWRE